MRALCARPVIAIRDARDAAVAALRRSVGAGSCEDLKFSTSRSIGVGLVLWGAFLSRDSEGGALRREAAAWQADTLGGHCGARDHRTRRAFFVGNILSLYVAIFAINMIGQFSFGFALWKYTFLPRVALGVFLASAILANLPPLPVLHYVLIAGGVAGGTGMVWLGWASRSVASRAVPERG